MDYRQTHRFMPPPPLAVPVPPPVTWYGGPFQYQPPSTNRRYDSCDEYRLYECRKIAESDERFDVEDCLSGMFASGSGSGIKPVSYVEHPVNDLRIYSELALMKYNEKEGSDLELVKVVKANVKVVAGFMYYITFDAKDPSAGDGWISTFQAQVWAGISKIEVQLVRPKVNA